MAATIISSLSLSVLVIYLLCIFSVKSFIPSYRVTSYSDKMKRICNGKIYADRSKVQRRRITVALDSSSSDYTAVMIVPTGIGASIGGFAGDALPACKLLAQVCDRVITHPNVMNGAMLYAQLPNVQYVEGFALDEFAAGRVGLIECKKKSQKIGLLLDRAIEPELRIRHLQVAEAFRATLGIDVSSCVITARPVGVTIATSTTGASWGSVLDPEAILDAAGELINQGCTAIAIVVRFPEDNTEEEQASFDLYRKGGGVDCIAGAEAIISHIVTQRFLVPCAHAPAFEPYEADKEVSPKSCAEELGYTFLPCVLNYLHRAPSLVSLQNGYSDRVSKVSSSILTRQCVDAVIAPIDALGGPAVLSLLGEGVLVVAVGDNTSVMQVTEEALRGSDKGNSNGNIVHARSYAEAAGILLAHKAGILLSSITADVPRIPVIGPF